MLELSEHDKAFIVDGIPESNLVLFCPALQGRGATLFDRSRYANHGTISGATWKRLPSGLWTLSYSGGDVDTHFASASQQDLNLGDWTVLAWFYPYDTSYSGWGGISLGNAYYVGFCIALIRFLSTDGTGFAVNYSPAPSWQVWQFYAVTHDISEKTLKMYINTTQVGSTVYTGTLPTGNTNIILARYATATNGAQLNMALLEVENRLLTTTEMTRIYTRQRLLLGV